MEDSSHDFVTMEKPKKKKSIQKLYKKLFNVLSFIQGEEENEKLLAGSGRLHILIMVFDSFQAISLLYTSESIIKNWDNFSSFWAFFSYTRLDFIAFKFNFAIYLVAIVSCFHILMILIVIYLMTSFSSTDQISLKLSNYILRIPFHLISRYLQFPLFLVAMAYFKYIGSNDYLVEYGVYSYIPGNYLKFWLVLFMIFSFIISTIKENLMYECGHALLKTFNDGKITGKYDYYRLLCKDLQVFLYFFLLPISSPAYYLVNFTMFFFISLIFYSRLPYYNKKFNVAAILSLWISSFACLAFFIGSYQNESTIIFVLILVSIPILSILSHYCVTWRLENLDKKSFEYISEYWMYEIYFRKNFLSTSIDTNTILNNQNKNDSLMYCKIIYVIESLYLFFAKDEPIRARSHLAMSRLLKFDLEWDYQAYRSEKYFKKDRNSDTFKYMLMLESIKVLKSDDKAVCEMIFEICRLISQKFKNTSKIINLIRKVNPRLRKLKEDYQKFTKQYPNNSELLLDYGSVLVVFFNEMNLGMNCITKANTQIKSIPPNSYSLTPFKEYTANVVIDCDKRFLTVTYSNTLANNYLEYHRRKLTGMGADKLIPTIFEYTNSGNFNIMDLLDTHLPGSFFLFNSDEFLMPVFMKLDIDSLNLKRKILLTFIPNAEFVGDAAIVEKSGKIIGHTQNFGLVLGLDAQVKGDILSVLLPSHGDIIEYLYQPMHFDRDIYLFSNCIEINKHTVVIVLALKGDKQLHYWENVYSEQLGDDYMACCPLDFDEEQPFENKDENIPIVKSINLQDNNPRKSVLLDFSEKYSEEFSDFHLQKSDPEGEQSSKTDKSKLYYEHKKNFNTVLKMYKNLKWASTFSILGIVGGCIAYLILYQNNVNNIIEITQSKMEISYASFYLLQAGQYARLFHLQNITQLDFDYSNNLTQTQENIVQVYAKINSYMNQNMALKNKYIKEKIPVRLLTSKNIETITYINFFDLLSEYIRRITLINNTNDFDDQNFLYQNSFGECFHKISSSEFFSFSNDLNWIFSTAFLLFISSIIAFCIIFFFMYLNIFRKIIIKTGRPIFSMKQALLLTIASEIKMRLEQVHSNFSMHRSVILEHKKERKIKYHFFFGYTSLALLILFATGLIIFIEIEYETPVSNFELTIQNLPLIYQSINSNVLKIWQFSFENSLNKSSDFAYFSNFTEEFEKSQKELKLSDLELMGIYLQTNSEENLNTLIYKTNSIVPNVQKGLIWACNDFINLNSDAMQSKFPQNIQNYLENYEIGNEINLQIFNLTIKTVNDSITDIKNNADSFKIYVIIFTFFIFVSVIMFVRYIYMMYKRLQSLVDFMRSLDLLNPNRKIKTTY